MNGWQAALLGAIQGLTEFLPVSSSGHLVLVGKILHAPGQTLAFDVFLHAGTLLAVIMAFWTRLTGLFARPWSQPVRLVALSTVPTVAIGLLFKEAFQAVFDSGATLGWEFILTGLLILWAEANSRSAKDGATDVGYRQAWWIGVAQGAAIMPALSRSGLTLCTALAMGVNRETAVEYSFLLSIPVILGATLLEARDLSHFGAGMPPLWIGFFASAITGYAAIRLMLRLIRRVSLHPFAYYTLALGIAILADQHIAHTVF